jgi:uncharacterized protein YrzB (UPF0473 family)
LEVIEMTADKDDVITLIDENTGKEINFEFLCTVEYNGNEYVCLVPAEEVETEDDFENVVILKIVKGKGNEEEQLITIDDDDEYNAVFELMQDELNIEDECGEDCDCDGGCCGGKTEDKN